MSLVRYLFSFHGRIGRLQWWLGGLAQLLLVAPFAILFVWGLMTKNPGAIFASFLFLPFMLWCGICLTVKRLHDHDKSGWWCLFYLIPVIGGIWQLIECGLLAGTPGGNDFGTDPLFTFNVDDEIEALRAKAEAANAVSAVLPPPVMTQLAPATYVSARPVFGKRA